MSVPSYLQYKDSGTDWIGPIPRGWKVLPLKRIAAVRTQRADDHTFAVALENIESWSGAFIEADGTYESDGVEFDAGDILFGKLRPYLAKAWLADRPGQAVGDFHVLRCTPDQDPAFVQRVLLTREVISLIDGSTYGAKMPRASWDFMGTLVVPLPTAAEQRAIVIFLDQETAKIDALVGEQYRLIALLREKQLSAISHGVTKGLELGTRLKDSGAEWLGQVPRSWGVVSARRLFKERDHRSETGEEDLLTVSHLTGVTLRSEKNVTMIEAETTEGYKICQSGDLVINTLWAWMGAMGISPVHGIVSPAYNIYVPCDGLDPSYVGALVRMPVFAREASRYSKGVWSSRLRLYPEGFFNIRMPLPPLEVQRDIVSYVETLTSASRKLIAEAERAISLLKERRAALISAAVTGKIDVRALAPPVRQAA